ncbi:MAG: protein-glutamine gamma-glutamyltransferase [Clostridiales bacterium]|nr:protein-glutamine gamma-glutamyltransferase [Clostridiales bacterium]
MLLVDNKPIDAAFLQQYPAGSIQRKALEIMQKSEETLRYGSLDELKFELELRNAIVKAAEDLSRSGLRFAVFSKSYANPDYWTRRSDGGFLLKTGVKASDAIRDIFKNGRLYGTECATAMPIVYFKALLDVFGDEAFNKMFSTIYLMNWRYLPAELSMTGRMQKTKTYLPGDRRYITNPDVDPQTPEWQGENVIDLGNGRYYGHGMGRRTIDEIVRALNQNRFAGARREAYLLDTVGRPDFRRLFREYQRSRTQQVAYRWVS